MSIRLIAAGRDAPMKLAGSASQRRKQPDNAANRGSLRQPAMSRSSCRTAFGLSSSPMRSGFRRNFSRSCKRTGSFPVDGTDSIRLAARSCPVWGWVCVAAAAPDPRRPQPHCPRLGLPSNTVCVVTVVAPPVTFGRAASVDRAQRHWRRRKVPEDGGKDKFLGGCRRRAPRSDPAGPRWRHRERVRAPDAPRPRGSVAGSARPSAARRRDPRLPRAR